jgi:hypothetical protein
MALESTTPEPPTLSDATVRFVARLNETVEEAAMKGELQTPGGSISPTLIFDSTTQSWMTSLDGISSIIKKAK